MLHRSEKECWEGLQKRVIPDNGGKKKKKKESGSWPVKMGLAI